ncbi:MAG: hypothetical protein ACRDGV_08780 [Candidatus Limnocylindria bacterium]
MPRIRGNARRGALIAAMALLLAACTLPPLATSTPTPSPTPTAQPTPTAAPTPGPTATPEPTPDAAAIPVFRSGQIIVTATDGLRIRNLPGTDRRVMTGLLPAGAELQVIMGPVLTEGFGWYFVTDADPDEPQFSEGWIAAGYDPDPFLAASAREPEPDDPLVAGFANTGDAEHGPIPIADEDHLIRWLALDPEDVGCRFAVSLMPSGAEPVPTIRATIGRTPTPGTLQPSFFAGQPSLRGQLFMTVESDCAWTLAFVRHEPEDAPEPTG